MLEAAMQFSSADEIEQYIRTEMAKRLSESPRDTHPALGAVSTRFINRA
jgi:hypothetical protein